MTEFNKFEEKEEKQELPFQKQDKESEEAWCACLQYVLMGKGRTLLDAYRIYCGRSDAKSVAGSFRSWAKRFGWEDRAKLFDTFQQRKTKNVVSRAIARVRKGCEYDYQEIFTELKHLVIEDLAIDTALQLFLNQEIEKLSMESDEVSTSRLRELVQIRKDILSARKLAMEQASAVYGFGLLSGVENVVDVEASNGEG